MEEVNGIPGDCVSRYGGFLIAGCVRSFWQGFS